jgi:hypothetical protein
MDVSLTGTLLFYILYIYVNNRETGSFYEPTIASLDPRPYCHVTTNWQGSRNAEMQGISGGIATGRRSDMWGSVPGRDQQDVQISAGAHLASYYTSTCVSSFAGKSAEA